MRILKNVAKRMLSLTLAIVMVVSLCPQLPIEVHAKDVTSGVPTGLKASWSDSNSSFTNATAKGGCNSTTTATLTFTNVSGGAATLSFKWTATINGSVTIDGGGAITTSPSGDQSFTKELSPGGTATVAIMGNSGEKTTTITIKEVSLKTTVTFGTAEGPGSYTITKSDNTTVTPGSSDTDSCGTTYTLVATMNDGAAFQGWYSGSTRVSENPNYTLKTYDSGNPVYNSVYPKFSYPESTITELDPMVPTDDETLST